MFSGIVSEQGKILSVKKHGDLRVTISCDWPDVKIGESVAVNGVCLTVVEKDKKSFSVDVSAETLQRTAAYWKEGQAVNLERALKMGDDVSGHFVTGHVDGVATLVSTKKSGDSHSLCFDAPKELTRFIAPKGSVTLDGVSLTVNKVEGDKFWVNIIPHTWQNTSLSRCETGDGVNLEIDVIARYVDRMLVAKKV